MKPLELPLATARLLLRRFATADLEGFQAYRSDAELARFQGWTPVSDDEAKEFLTGQSRQVLGAQGEWLQVALARRATGQLIGDLGLCVVDAARRSVELGFTVARFAQRRGYASEAVARVLTALRDAQVRSVVATTDTRNGPSVALLRRSGFILRDTSESVFRGEVCQEHVFVHQLTAPGSGN